MAVACNEKRKEKYESTSLLERAANLLSTDSLSVAVSNSKSESSSSRSSPSSSPSSPSPSSPSASCSSPSSPSA
eukprot:2248116-Pleurochrysis_carterae.AAC.1